MNRGVSPKLKFANHAAIITDIIDSSPLTLLYTYTITGCARPTTETRVLTAYAPGGSYHASPATLTSSGQSGVSTVAFVFESLLEDMLVPGEALALVLLVFDKSNGDRNIYLPMVNRLTCQCKLCLYRF